MRRLTRGSDENISGAGKRERTDENQDKDEGESAV